MAAPKNNSHSTERWQHQKTTLIQRKDGSTKKQLIQRKDGSTKELGIPAPPKLKGRENYSLWSQVRIHLQGSLATAIRLRRRLMYQYLKDLETYQKRRAEKSKTEGESIALDKPTFANAIKGEPGN
jgi:hypothetical protein